MQFLAPLGFYFWLFFSSSFNFCFSLVQYQAPCTHETCTSHYVSFCHCPNDRYIFYVLPILCLRPQTLSFVRHNLHSILILLSSFAFNRNCFAIWKCSLFFFNSHFAMMNCPHVHALRFIKSNIIQAIRSREKNISLTTTTTIPKLNKKWCSLIQPHV